jgi:hypothetical protein
VATTGDAEQQSSTISELDSMPVRDLVQLDAVARSSSWTQLAPAAGDELAKKFQAWDGLSLRAILASLHIAADTLMAYLTGFVLQEQSQGSTLAPFPIPLPELHQRFPRVFRNLDTSDDDTAFQLAVGAILDGFTHPASSAVTGASASAADG